MSLGLDSERSPSPPLPGAAPLDFDSEENGAAPEMEDAGAMAPGAGMAEPEDVGEEGGAMPQAIAKGVAPPAAPPRPAGAVPQVNRPGQQVDRPAPVQARVTQVDTTVYT